MKKSKVIIPALGVLILSTAASVTGTVAWFTANRTATITAGEFAVVNTNDNLAVTLGAGVATAKASDTSIANSGSLTDGSFNHLYIADNPVLPIINPNVSKTKVLSAVALSSANTTNLSRGTNVYTAMTWTMTFTIEFSEAANKHLGLYLDLSDAETYMHEKVTYASEHTIKPTEAGTYYSDAACTADAQAKESGQTLAAGTYYKAAPEASGKAFRIAFVPTAMTKTDGNYGMAYTKVWADNEASGETNNGLTACQFVNQHAVDANLVGTAYATDTVSYNGTSYAAATASDVLMNSGDNDAIPADDARSTTTALSTDRNYLGYFACTPSATKSITYTCVAWYEGSHPQVQTNTTELEKIVVSMKFGVTNLSDVVA